MHPICQPCARIYGEALRYLLETDRHHLRLGDVTWVYWTKKASGFDPFTALTDAEPRDVERLLGAPYRSAPPGEIDTEPFYAAALTSNISRLAVRSWVTTTVGAVKKNVARYFERMRLSGSGGPDGPRYHGIYALAGSTVRELDDLPPHTIETLLAHALTGRRLPMSLLHQAIRRARAEGGITHPRAALFKLVLLSNQSNTITPMLNPNHENPAYHCGRLLAVLESIQRRPSIRIRRSSTATTARRPQHRPPCSAT